MFNHLFDTEKKISIQSIRLQSGMDPNYFFDIARFDEIDPVVSGNKFFKLKYNIRQALNEKKNGIITMGGAFSNHLAATARACNLSGLYSVGIIRGEIPAELNHTLQYCVSQNMKLIPGGRIDYAETGNEIQKIIREHPDLHFVPMGGANEEGIKGAAEMAEWIPNFQSYEIIICAIGSGTMFKGIQRNILAHQTLIGIPVIKIRYEQIDEYIESFTDINALGKTIIYPEFSGKGYAKIEPKIISFMNQFCQEHKTPLDFVYTGKLLFALTELLKTNRIDKTQKILAIHSGGLQGNLSLPSSTLIF